jgi:hypothetical protein
MSQAFVKETDDQWLNEVGPSLRALCLFLTRENGGISVYEQRNFIDDNGVNVHVMSNGLSYAKNEKSEWYILA